LRATRFPLQVLPCHTVYYIYLPSFPSPCYTFCYLLLRAILTPRWLSVARAYCGYRFETCWLVRAAPPACLLRSILAPLWEARGRRRTPGEGRGEAGWTAARTAAAGALLVDRGRRTISAWLRCVAFKFIRCLFNSPSRLLWCMQRRRSLCYSFYHLFLLPLHICSRRRHAAALLRGTPFAVRPPALRGLTRGCHADDDCALSNGGRSSCLPNWRTATCHSPWVINHCYDCAICCKLTYHTLAEGLYCNERTRFVVPVVPILRFFCSAYLTFIYSVSFVRRGTTTGVPTADGITKL